MMPLLLLLLLRLLLRHHWRHSAQQRQQQPNGVAVGSSNGDSSGEDNPLVWVLHYLAQHYDKLGGQAKAVRASNEALCLAPTLIELLLARARVLKHAGDLVGAAAAADTARSYDLADRYTNSIAVKALFAAGQIEAAEQTAMLFTRDGDQVHFLHELICYVFDVMLLNYCRWQAYQLSITH
eukprot:GHRR01019426.1.p1 GENE.GHRR01019426.1~~GHRR01019426.1.p1  ORF type:complete len:181 (+),score=71.78 GHRR01019426.1:1425-1967(+)